MPRPKSVLIVDDEPHVRTYLRMLMRHLGVERITEASDGEQALKLYAAERPELVLLDVVMPGRQGTSVLTDLHAINPELPVIVVTSQVALKTVQEMHAKGAVAYVLKHTPRDQMLKILTEALDSLSNAGGGAG